MLSHTLFLSSVLLLERWDLPEIPVMKNHGLLDSLQKHHFDDSGQTCTFCTKYNNVPLSLRSRKEREISLSGTPSRMDQWNLFHWFFFFFEDFKFYFIFKLYIIRHRYTLISWYHFLYTPWYTIFRSCPLGNISRHAIAQRWWGCTMYFLKNMQG